MKQPTSNIKKFQKEHGIYPRYSHTNFNISPDKMKTYQYLLLKQTSHQKNIVFDIAALLKYIKKNNVKLRNYGFIVAYDKDRDVFFNKKEGIPIHDFRVNEIPSEKIEAIELAQRVNNKKELRDFLEKTGSVFTKRDKSNSDNNYSKDAGLVQSLNDILINFNTLSEYYLSNDSDLRTFYLELVKKGTCFVVTKINDDLFFAPSRFVGYLNNRQERHIANQKKDGRITNPIIEKIVGRKFSVNEGLERAYQNFCYSLSFTPRAKGSFGVTRKYIAYDIPDLTPDDFISDDLQDIERQNKLSKTEKEHLVKARLGQGRFRESLIDYWKGCCCTGCKDLSMLRASHIKPWRLCNNEERLDIFNGLLLAPNFDQAFDNGLITFDVEGKIILSDALNKEDSDRLGIYKNYWIELNPKHELYMQFHREYVHIK